MAQQRPRTNYEQFFRRDEAVKVDEAVHVDENDDPLCSLDIEDQDLPFIPAEIVGSKDGKKGSKLCESAATHSKTASDVDYPRDRDR